MECELPDVQCTAPNIGRSIRQVGVEDVEVPFKLESKYGGHHQLIANVSMRVNLDNRTKGISMSRLIRTLRKYLDLPLKRTLVQKILEDLKNTVGGERSYMKFEFKFPMNRMSPKSQYIFPLYYNCRFEGQLINEQFNFGEMHKPVTSQFKFYQGVRIQYASYCPCSAELCNDLKDKDIIGFPHAQRSFADILIETDNRVYIWLEDIVEAVIKRICTLPYAIIKRVDEQEIARIAAKNPMFVEDAIRLISESLDEMEGISDWIVKCNHEESIHTSDAIAINWKGVTNGFNGRRFI